VEIDDQAENTVIGAPDQVMLARVGGSQVPSPPPFPFFTQPVFPNKVYGEERYGLCTAPF